MAELSESPATDKGIRTASISDQVLDRSIAREYLRENRDELHQWLRYIWGEYMKWFTFLSTLNVAGLALTQKIIPQDGFLVCLAFSVFNILGLVGTITIQIYSFISLRRTDRLLNLLKGLATDQELPSPIKQEFLPTLPLFVPIWTGIANFTAIAFFALIWSYLAIVGSHGGQVFPSSG